MKLNQIKSNPENPRVIKDNKFQKLKKSIEAFPEMMTLRPIVVDEDGMILGGNMRYEAIKELFAAKGQDEIPDEWILRAEDLTDEQKSEFVIKDNVGFGDWDWDLLANEWDDMQLADWGLDLPTTDLEVATPDETDLSSKLEPIFKLEIECPNEQYQKEAFEKLTEEGYQCRILTL